jgi:hypothetical protein
MVKLKEKNKKEFLNYILNAENIHFIRYRKNEREILRLNIEQCYHVDSVCNVAFGKRSG